LLSGQGFKEVYNLAGGIKGFQSGGGVASGPPETGMGLITGRETGSEMLVIVYGMEEGMRTLYQQLSGRVTDEEASGLFQTLSELEVHHKEMIFELYQKHGGELDSIESMDEHSSFATTESGMTVEELVDSFRPDESSVEEVLGYAMMLETQALDLYLRYWRQSEDPETKTVLLELADEEKNHLGYLGELLEKRAGE
jgi:rubrerythrin